MDPCVLKLFSKNYFYSGKSGMLADFEPFREWNTHFRTAIKIELGWVSRWLSPFWTQNKQECLLRKEGRDLREFFLSPPLHWTLHGELNLIGWGGLGSGEEKRLGTRLGMHACHLYTKLDVNVVVILSDPRSWYIFGFIVICIGSHSPAATKFWEHFAILIEKAKAKDISEFLKYWLEKWRNRKDKYI